MPQIISDEEWAKKDHEREKRSIAKFQPDITLVGSPTFLHLYGELGSTALVVKIGYFKEFRDFYDTVVTDKENKYFLYDVQPSASGDLAIRYATFSKASA